jgi:hypothetical protein
MATERFHEHGNARLVLDDQRPHDVVEVRAMISTVALGAVHDLFTGWLVAVIAAVTMTARAVKVHRGGAEVQTRHGRRRDKTLEGCYPIAIEGIQGTTERLIVQLLGGHTGREESGGGLILEKPGDEVERLSDTPQAIEPHRVDRFTSREVPQFRGLLRGLSHDIANAECVKQARHTAEMVEDLAAVRGVVGPNTLLCW